MKIIAAIDDPPVIVKILSHLGYRPAPRRVRRRVESIYSKRSEEPKIACQRKPTAPLALSSTDRRDLLPARTCDLRAAPDPAIQDPNKAATLTQLSYV